ncbi:MAG: NADH/ubiquinone/plastoquinone (complex I) [Kiritimatiellae bacterium]|nr:NADH/ubiquinone/plastoquinone (complex I) [Kiritimatiellia bacterium]MDW8457787.1 proton-conducting transporter membrane subunit [Verrucomicrobiota bacterium]
MIGSELVNHGLLALALVAPLLAAAAPRATIFAALAPLPTIGLAFAEPFEVGFRELLLGARFGVSTVNAPFLLIAGCLWTAATWFARHYMAHDGHANRYHVFHRLAMAGNIGLILAQDLATFYFFFALMSLASYPLVIHDGRTISRRAGRVYLALALLGEVVQFAAFSVIASQAGGWTFPAARSALTESPYRPWLLGMVIAGFGIKAALVPLHVWLPLAHPVAPTPASAVLSGSMIKAGLLGWLNLLPLGGMAAPALGEGLMVAGLLGVFGAALVGVTQRQPKTVLAYSSISQMGLMILAVGIALASPEATRYVLPAVFLYALHHALAKCALFLGVGMAASAPRANIGRIALWIGLAICGLALAGAPLTSGAVAKVFLKAVAAAAPGEWPDRLAWLLPCGAVGTTLLMARFLWTLRAAIDSTPDSHHAASRSIWMPWTALLALVILLPWWFAQALHAEKTAQALSMKYAGTLAVPVVVGALAAMAARYAFSSRAPEIPAGDVLAIPAWAVSRLTSFYRLQRPSLGRGIRAAEEARSLARDGMKGALRGLAGAERYLRTLAVAGFALALLAALTIWRLAP